MSVEIGNIEIKGIIRRRKKMFITFFALVFCICTIVAFVLPSVYRSEAMIVVENQEIPEDYVKSTMTTFLSERLQLLTNKILSYGKLLEIVKKHQVYPDLGTESEMVTKMRDAIELETIDVSLKDKQSGGKGLATVAFNLSFEHNNAELAKTVADTLASLFVQEDQKTRQKMAVTTTTFLEKELEGLRRQVQLNEEKISRFKATNLNRLPGSTGVFAQTIFRLEQQINDIDTRIRTGQEKIVYLKNQIGNIDPLIPIMTEDGKVASNPNNRLKYLRLQLIGMQANFSEKHPDIIRMKSEIKELEAQVGKNDTTSEQVNRLAIVEKEMAELNSKYGDKHPDVIRLTKESDLLKRQIGAAQHAKVVEDERTDNPGYMNIKAQIITADAEIEALRDERIKVAAQLEDYQQRLEAMPFIEEEYNFLTLDYANAKRKFDEVSNKLHTAKISQEMDTSERGERFRIDSPANLPDRPDKPNRLLIILMGFVLGIGGGTVLVALAEGLDSSVKAPDELESITGVPVLATVSFVESAMQKRLRRAKQLIVLTTVVVVVLIASLMINWFVMPMDELWAKFEDRLVEIGVPIKNEPEEL